MVILGTNLGYRLYPLQHYEYKEINDQKISLNIVMDYTEVVCNHIYIGTFVSRTKRQMQSGVKSGANTLLWVDLWSGSAICIDYSSPPITYLI